MPECLMGEAAARNMRGRLGPPTWLRPHVQPDNTRRRRRIDDILLKEMRSRSSFKDLTPPDSSLSSSRCKRNGFQPRMGAQDEFNLADELELASAMVNEG